LKYFEPGAVDSLMTGAFIALLTHLETHLKIMGDGFFESGNILIDKV